MARGNRLTALGVTRLNKPGRYGDGLGLWLQVTEQGTKSWLYRYMLNGRARQMGLGPVHTISLAEARDRAAAARKLTLDGQDPIEKRKAHRNADFLSAAQLITFAQCGEQYVEAHEAGWRNPKHRAQWRATLKTYVYPIIGKLAVGAIDTAAVLKVLSPIWHTKPETAGRVRGRIESILDWAKVREFRQGENPARWRGHLEHSLPSKSKLRAVKPHSALPYADIPDFMKELRKQSGLSPRALEFMILTAARTSEAIAARWSEIDLPGKSWTVPASRMKAHREHRVPLSNRAIAILKALTHEGEFVFPGTKLGMPLSNMSLLATLRRLGRDDLTAHGFRSTFRDWVAETTNYPNEVAEMALAHTISNKAEAAYRRGDLLEKRRELAEDWARYCGDFTR